MAQVHHCLLDQTIKQASASGGGLLIGFHAPHTDILQVIDVLYVDVNQIPSHSALAALRHALTQGLSYVGLFGPSKPALAALSTHISTFDLLSPGLMASGKDQTNVLTAVIASGACDYAWLNPEAASWQLAEVVPGTVRMDAWGWIGQPTALCSVQLRIPLDVFTTGAVGSAQALTQAIRSAETTMCQNLRDTCTTFLVTGKGGCQVLVSGSSTGSVIDLVRTTPTPIGDHVAALVAQPLQNTMTSPQSSPLNCPVYKYQVASSTTLTHHQAILTITALAYIPTSTPLKDLAALWLLPAVLRGVRAAVGVMMAGGKVSDMVMQHYAPPGRSHHLSLAYPVVSRDIDKFETDLITWRAELHRLLGLPVNRPCLRLANAISIQTEAARAMAASATGQSQPQRLKDVHLGLNQPVPGGQVAILDGSYDYHHYMQDKFNDAGWGCAYRSLQTIISWFRQQHYTTKPIPTHREVQQILVRLGDKSSDFIGSTNWIGAIELSYILDEYLGVTSKIITVNRGADIPSYARQLAAHFSTQGTPVMIGGGVLAYTLLGVSFDEVTGDCAFLILDPHYTSGEDLRKIQSGTWIAWKKPGDTAAAGGPLFVQDAFYNFLCPQRPQQV